MELERIIAVKETEEASSLLFVLVSSAGQRIRNFKLQLAALPGK